MSVVRTVDDEPPPSARPTDLTTRQRLALVVGGALTPQEVLSAEDAALDFAYFVKHKITSEALASVEIGPLQLKQRGATKAAQLRELGYETRDLRTFTADVSKQAMQQGFGGLLMAAVGVGLARHGGLDVRYSTGRDLHRAPRRRSAGETAFRDHLGRIRNRPAPTDA